MGNYGGAPSQYLGQPTGTGTSPITPQSVASMLGGGGGSASGTRYAAMSQDEINQLFGVSVDPISGQRVSSKPLINWAEYNRASDIASSGLRGAGGGAGFGVGPNGQPLTYGQAVKKLVDEGKLPYSALFGVAQLPESIVPGAGFENLSARTNATLDAAQAAAVPDFNALKKQFADNQAKLNAAYTASTTGNKAAQDLAAKSVADYSTKGQAALDRYLANAQDFYSKDIPASIQDALNRATQYTSRYGAGRGLGSDIVSLAGRSAVQAALPFQLQGRQYLGGALEKYQPFYGDVAARQMGVAEFDQRANQQQILNMRQAVIDAGLPEEEFNRILQQQQALKQGDLTLRDLAAAIQQKYGPQRFLYYLPGADVAQTGQSNLPMPRYPTNAPGNYNAPWQPQNIPGSVTPGSTPTDAMAQANQQWRDYYAKLNAARNPSTGDWAGETNNPTPLSYLG